MQNTAVFSESTYPNTSEHLSVRWPALRCPRCMTDSTGVDCLHCSFGMEMHNDIVCALPPERASYYARFIEDYEHIRAAEGRGSRSEDFYLALPYKDITGRNSQQWKIRARSYDYLIKHVLHPLNECRSILDLGAGNCWMSFRLALSGYEPVAVDLLTNDDDGLGAARHFQKYTSTPIPLFQAEAEHLPLQGEQFDMVIFNASFHYSQDYEVTLREALRCLKTKGMVVISDTPWYLTDESGRRMVAERRESFKTHFGTPSDSIKNLEYLTNERLEALEEKFSIQWTAHHPWYGWRWAMRPCMAKLRGQREPSRFRIYTAIKDAQSY